MTSITRTEYDLLRLADEPIPDVDFLIEPNGKRVDLIRTPTDIVQCTNPRIQSKEVRDVLVQLADLTEYYDLGVEQNNGPTPLSNLIESGEAFQLEHDQTLLELTRAALAQLDGWLAAPEAAKRKLEVKTFQQRAKWFVALLRAKGF